MKHKRTLQELFSYKGFRANAKLQGKFGEPTARIITLTRRKKRVPAQDVAALTITTTTTKHVNPAMWMQRAIESIYGMKSVACIAKDAKACE